MQSTRITSFGFAPTLFEKLFDDNPRYVNEINPLRRWNIEELKGSVARDLEALLNTRRSFSKTLDAYPLVRQSVLNFGILDFVGLSTANPEHCDRICKEIEQTIADHDPRLSQIHVEMDLDSDHVGSLLFTIRAVLVVYPINEMISFDAVLQPSTQQYSIRHTADHY
jgi:type VI secretion system protein ImpF